jgi:hypothetical protein
LALPRKIAKEDKLGYPLPGRFAIFFVIHNEDGKKPRSYPETMTPLATLCPLKNDFAASSVPFYLLPIKLRFNFTILPLLQAILSPLSPAQEPSKKLDY